MHVSIVIPVYNALELTKQCIASIFDVEGSCAFEVIVVDNGSAPDTEEWLLEEERRRPELRHLRYPQPLGFAKAVNRGAEAATGRILIVLNSDTFVTPGWLDRLAQALESDPSLGAITPATNQAGEPAQMDFATVDLPLAAALALMAKRPKSSDILYLPQRLTFFCVAIPREVWMELGGLDESYGVGNFEDDDFCLRLRVAGYRLGVARHVFVYHHNNATFHANGISHDASMSRNAVTFASHARERALASDAKRRWPKAGAMEISIVILEKKDASLDRTLCSLANQTVQGFEILEPGTRSLPARAWIAYITQGDILYPFHLEALFEALQRNHADSIFADGFVAATNEVCSEPGTLSGSMLSGSMLSGSMLSGWMHHSSLDPDRIWEESTPVHWQRITWEMQDAPALAEVSRTGAAKPRGLVESARQLYRRSVPFETRLALDARVRRLLGLKTPDAEETPFRELTARLESLPTGNTPPTTRTELPAVISFNAIPWHSATQRQHHFSRGLATRGHTVFWVDTSLRPPASWRPERPFQQVAPNVYLIRLPGPGRDVYHARWSEAALEAMAAALLVAMRRYGIQDVISLVNYPRWQPLAMRLRDRAGWKVVYDCLDDQAALADLYQTRIEKYEERLVDGADLMFTSSIVLRDRFSRRSPILLHNAADYNLFSSTLSMGHLRHLPRPLIGFFGALADWLDCELIHAAALRFPHWSFVYIGPNGFFNAEGEARWLRSTNLPNITLLPQMDPRALATHLAEFDVCTLPFLDVPATRAMNPVKLYEYLAAGKPTVARSLPEVRHLVNGEQGAADLIALYSTPEEFFARLTEAMAADKPELAARRQTFASRHDWSQRVGVLSAKISELVHETSSISASSSGSKTRSQE